MPVGFDRAFYPHLFDLVIDHAYDDGLGKTLATLRLTSSEVRDLVDRKLSTHLEIIDGDIRSKLLSIWRPEWMLGNPSTRVVDMYDDELPKEMTSLGAVLRRFMCGCRPQIVREFGGRNVTYDFGSSPVEDSVVTISLMDFSDMMPFTPEDDDRVVHWAVKSRWLNPRVRRNIATFVYHHGYGLQVLAGFDYALCLVRDCPALDLTFMFLPHSVLEDNSKLPVLPIVYAPRPRTEQLSHLLNKVVITIGINPNTTVRLVGAEYWEQHWWDRADVRIYPEGIWESLSAETEAERAREMWDKSFDFYCRSGSANHKPMDTEEKVEDAKRRVTFLSVDAFREQVGEKMFDLCTRGGRSWSREDIEWPYGYDSDEDY